MLIIPNDFDAYLIASGFTKTEKSLTTSYQCFDKAVFFLADNRILFEYHDPGDESKKSEWKTEYSFTGWSKLSFFNFSLLLHITGIVDLKTNFKKFKK